MKRIAILSIIFLWSVCSGVLVSAQQAEVTDATTSEAVKPETNPPPEAAGAPGDLSLEGVIAKLQDNYGKIDSYSTAFAQEIYSMSQGRVVSNGEGTVLYKKPSKMVWRYEKPEEHLYITEGNTIYDYAPADKEVYVMSVKDALYKSFLLGLGDVKKEFEVSFHSGRKMSGDGLYQLDLVPKDKIERETLGTITLYIDPQSFLVKRTRMTDALGNRNTIEFKNTELNPAIDKAEFDFKPPAGVKVIQAEDLMESDINK